MTCEFVKDYAANEVLRKSLGELAKKTFSIDIETWYQSGGWDHEYIPYSYKDGQVIVSSVFANKMKVSVDQNEYLFIQIGTIMTEKAYRGKGLSRKIIEQVIREYKGKADGFYLYANDSVTEFYPKFGFIPGYEYVYYRNILKSEKDTLIQPLKGCSEMQRKEFLHIRENSIHNERISMDNKGILKFWTDSLEEIYYLPEEECYVGAEFQEETMLLKQIFSLHKVDVNRVIDAFHEKAAKVELGFVPKETAGFEVKRIVKKHYNYFYIGEVLKQLEQQKVRFPEYSHA
ncbi:MAG: GNAT family N-acetyltransferase [bacterium]|nr:GNAT family N-acetyltransferase [bacterium]